MHMVVNEFDKKLIGLHARGVFVDDIKSEIHELYCGDMSYTTFSNALKDKNYYRSLSPIVISSWINYFYNNLHKSVEVLFLFQSFFGGRASTL